jgi:hypothetical protein
MSYTPALLITTGLPPEHAAIAACYRTADEISYQISILPDRVIMSGFLGSRVRCQIHRTRLRKILQNHLDRSL